MDDTRERELLERLAWEGNDRRQAEAELAAIARERDQERRAWLDARLQEASRLLGEGRVTEAHREVARVLGVEPGSPTAHLLMAKVLYREDRLEHAIRAARYAQSLSPADSHIDEYATMLETKYNDESKRALEWRYSETGGQQAPPQQGAVSAPPSTSWGAGSRGWWSTGCCAGGTWSALSSCSPE